MIIFTWSQTLNEQTNMMRCAWYIIVSLILIFTKTCFCFGRFPTILKSPPPPSLKKKKIHHHRSMFYNPQKRAKCGLMPLWLHTTCTLVIIYSAQQVYGKMLSIELYFTGISNWDILNMMGFQISEWSINQWNPVIWDFSCAIPKLLENF